MENDFNIEGKSGVAGCAIQEDDGTFTAVVQFIESGIVTDQIACRGFASLAAAEKMAVAKTEEIAHELISNKVVVPESVQLIIPNRQPKTESIVH